MATKKQHAIHLPQFYKECCRILKAYQNKEGFLKTLVFRSRYRNFRRLLGLLSKVVDNIELLQSVLEDSRMLQQEPKFDHNLATILAAEILFGHGSLESQSKPIITICKYTDCLWSSFDKLQHKSKSNSSVNRVSALPRYVLVNSLITSFDQLVEDFKAKGWQIQEYDTDTTYEEFLTAVQNMDKFTYMRDFHIDGLFVFPPLTPFWDTDLYEDKKIILQDKSSCMPVFLSGLRRNSKVIDACAAPGNKTSYIASFLGKKGSLTAVEYNKDRYEILLGMLSSRKVKNVNCINDDFTHINPDDFPDVEYIFVDPTCSSSGNINFNGQFPEDRIRKLASFQLCLLSHALSFPHVQVVIYSTCSVNVEENEDVIARALKKFGAQFELEDLSQHLKDWPHFGNEQYSVGQYCLRTVPLKDLCTGFFIAKFVRKALNSNCSGTEASECLLIKDDENQEHLHAKAEKHINAREDNSNFQKRQKCKSVEPDVLQKKKLSTSWKSINWSDEKKQDHMPKRKTTETDDIHEGELNTVSSSNIDENFMEGNVPAAMRKNKKKKRKVEYSVTGFPEQHEKSPERALPGTSSKSPKKKLTELNPSYSFPEEHENSSYGKVIKTGTDAQDREKFIENGFVTGICTVTGNLLSDAVSDTQTDPPKKKHKCTGGKKKKHKFKEGSF